MKKKISRNDFLKKGAVASSGVAAISLVGAGLFKTTKAKAEGTVYTWPWPYATLDPEVVRIKGHDTFWAGYACSAGALDAIISALQEALGAPYTNFPSKMLIFGHGGGAGWGTICGALNGAATAISLVTEKAVSDILVNELIGWYTLEKFPSDNSNTYAVDHAFANNNHDMDLVQGVCGSPLCHVSVSHWCGIADLAVGSNERKERCARLAGDVAAKAVELLNAHFDGTFVSSYEAPESIAECLACHGGAGMVANVSMKQTCIPCHGPEPHTSGVLDPKPLNHNFKVKQNFPNPFNNNTTIEFSLPIPEKVSIDVYNLNGQHIKTLVSNKQYSAGDYSLQWNGNDEHGRSADAGMYIFRIRAGQGMKTLSMMKM